MEKMPYQPELDRTTAQPSATVGVTEGAQRLEARAAVANGRGNGTLRKIGAVQEGVLRRSFLRNGQYHDQVLWSILAEDWRLQRMDVQPAIVH